MALADDGDAASPPPSSDVALNVNESAKPVEFSSVVPFGRFHYKILFLCGFGWATDNMWLTGLSFERQSIVQEFGVTNFLSGVMSSLLFAGLFFGAGVWGLISDRRGRKFAFTATLALAACGALVAAAMPLFPLICVMVFVLGAGAGGNLPVDGSMFAEFIPSARRGFWMVVLAAFWPLGGFAITALCWAFIPHTEVWLGWRLALGTNAILCAVFFFFRRSIPESPRFLVLQGRTTEAEDVIRNIAAENKYTIPADVDLTAALATAASDHPLSGNLWHQVRQIFAPEYRRITITLWFIWFLMSLGYGGFNFFLPSFLSAKGLPDTDVFLDAVLYNVAGLPGSFMASFLVETRFGRKYTLVLFVALAGASVVLFGFASSQIEVIACSMFASLCSQVAYAVIYTYTPEIYPTSVRTIGTGAASAASRIAGVIAPLLGSALLGETPFISFGLYAGCFVAVAVAAVTLKVETRGRDLDDSASGSLSIDSQLSTEPLLAQESELNQGSGRKVLLSGEDHERADNDSL